MKEAVGATSIFQIVILFILLFTAIMCLTINNANAFGVKDDITNIIEVNQGKYIDNDGNLSVAIVDSIKENQYRVTGKCPPSDDNGDGYKGYNKAGVAVNAGEKASICINKVDVTGGVDNYLNEMLGNGNFAADDFLNGVYYQVIVFYQLDLPVINQVFNFQTKGETKIIYIGNAKANI